MWKRERKGLLPLPPLGPRHHFYRKKLKFLKIFFILYHIQFFRFLLNWKRKDVQSSCLFIGNLLQIKKILWWTYMTNRISILEYAISNICSFIDQDIFHIYMNGIEFPFGMPWWWNGRHARLKISCLRAWRFESSSRHNIAHAYWMSNSMANLVEYLNRLR